MSTAFDRLQGITQGRLSPPAQANPVSGQAVFVLGSDTSGVYFPLNLGDYAQVQQTADTTGLKLIRFQAVLRSPTDVPEGTRWALEWGLESTVQGRRILSPGQSLHLRDGAINVTTLEGDQTFFFRLRFIGASGFPPIIEGITPSTGASSGADAVTITGSGFTGATGADLGGSDIGAFTVVDDSTITGTTSGHAAGVVAIRVSHPNGDAWLFDAYGYSSDFPALSGSSITQSDASDPSDDPTPFSVFGSALDSATSITFDRGGPNESTGVILANTSTQIDVLPPSLPMGTYTIDVTTSFGTSNTISINVWSPADATSATLIHRYLPFNVNDATDGADVTDIYDLVGTLSLVSDVGFRPTYQASNPNYNGRACISFSNAYLKRASGAAAVATMSAPITMLFVGNMNNDCVICNGDDRPALTTNFNELATGSGNVSFYADEQPGAFSPLTASISVATPPRYVLFTDTGDGSGSAAALAVNSTLPYVTGTTIWQPMTAYQIGYNSRSNPGGVAHATGDMVELILYDGVLSSPEKVNLAFYLFQKYGI